MTLAGTLHWDFLRLFGDVLAGLRRAAAGGPVASSASTRWGVDFGLLDARGRLLGHPVHYRDRRTDGHAAEAADRAARGDLPRDRHPVHAHQHPVPVRSPRGASAALEAAATLLMMPDLFHHFLAGERRRRGDHREHQPVPRPAPARLGTPAPRAPRIPAAILPEVVSPGRAGSRPPGVAAATGLRGRPVVVPLARHRLGGGRRARRSPPRSPTSLCGTWSLIGLEMAAPGGDAGTLAANLTNEGGVGGTIRLLRNVMGLWLVQESRRALVRQGGDARLRGARAACRGRAAFTRLVDPDDEFLRPGDMPGRVGAACRATGQPVPDDRRRRCSASSSRASPAYRYVRSS